MGIKEPEFLKKSRPEGHYMDISLEKDSHFYNISVNTKMSCVHVPTNIYFKGKYYNLNLITIERE